MMGDDRTTLHGMRFNSQPLCAPNRINSMAGDPNVSRLGDRIIQDRQQSRWITIDFDCRQTASWMLRIVPVLISSYQHTSIPLGRALTHTIDATRNLNVFYANYQGFRNIYSGSIFTFISMSTDSRCAQN